MNHHILGLKTPSSAALKQAKTELIVQDVSALRGWEAGQTTVVALHVQSRLCAAVCRERQGQSHFGLYRMTHTRTSLSHLMTWERLKYRQTGQLRRPGRAFLEALDTCDTTALSDEDRQHVPHWLTSSWEELWRTELLSSLTRGSRLRWHTGQHTVMLSVSRTRPRTLPDLTDDEGRPVRAKDLLHQDFEVTLFHP